MQATAISVALVGLQAEPVRVEVDSGRGCPVFHIVGLPEASVRESKMRVRAALAQLGVDTNEFVLTVNLAPADLRKKGGAFDLAIALCVLAALGKIDAASLEGVLLLGELSLNGNVHPVRGVMPALLGASRRGVVRAIVPAGNAAEAAVIESVRSWAAHDLRDVVLHLQGKQLLAETTSAPRAAHRAASGVDLSQVRGQGAARRALEVAAAGGHNLLMSGPPGAGKTMLARRLPTILPAMTHAESIEVTAVHSVAGLLPRDAGLLRERPFRAPHHTISAAALLGGGSPVRPGEVSLAHHGCLFLDELLEYRRHVLEGLRQPLESGSISICRANGRAVFPARTMLVAAMNPCPCGFAGDRVHKCRCPPERVQAYRSRLSGPLLDRIDLHVGLPRVPVSELAFHEAGESSATVRARVERARAVQLARYESGETGSPTNAQLMVADLDRVTAADARTAGLMQRAADRLGLSARGYVRLQRVARTLADLEGSAAVCHEHFQLALQLRTPEGAEGDSAFPEAV